MTHSSPFLLTKFHRLVFCSWCFSREPHLLLRKHLVAAVVNESEDSDIKDDDSAPPFDEEQTNTRWWCETERV